MGKTFRKKNRGKKVKSRTRKYKRSMKHRGGGGSMSTAMPHDPSLETYQHGMRPEDIAIEAALTDAENRIRALRKKSIVTRTEAADANKKLDAANAAASVQGYRKSTVGHYIGLISD